MSKSVLVIDTPSSCGECILYTGYSCHVYTRPIHCPCNTKPDWCPLSSLPERMNLRQYVENGALDMDGILNYQYAQGWNDCIEEILKGEN